jgi:HEPN domain-containing protein
MSALAEVREVIEHWVRKAEHDLEAAARIMSIEEGCPFDTVCFHCQQAAEKFLKGLLTHLGFEAPKSHDLTVLASLLPAEIAFPVPAEDLAELNPYAVAIRYVDDWREPRLEDAVRALALARKVRTAVMELLPPYDTGMRNQP